MLPLHLPDLDPANLPEDLRNLLRDYLSLKDVQLRATREPAEGLYLAEGVEVIRRALAAGHRPRSLLLSEQRAADLAADLAAAGVDAPVLLAPVEAFARLTGVDLHRGALASMHRPAPRAARDLLPGARRLVVLEDVVDHTNVGAVFRSAAALGADGVLVSPRCADPLYRRSVRVSMGTALSLPWARATSWPGDLDVLRGAGFTVVALALAEDAVTGAAIDQVRSEAQASWDELLRQTPHLMEALVRARAHEPSFDYRTAGASDAVFASVNGSR